MFKYINNIVSKYFTNNKQLVVKINSLEDCISKLSDAELKAKTNYFKEKLSNGATLDDILCEAFAVTREASSRVLQMKHFDVQLFGGVILHQGKIAEMKTGEGKTLVATLPVYLNALTGKGVHVITVNDYLAKRDSEWMGQIYNYLDLSVGTITHSLEDDERKKQYHSDITYGTNHEFGFDYLRDHMKFSNDEIVQRDLNYGIVDEVDFILIDEARTPLIISGQGSEDIKKYSQINAITKKLIKDIDYTTEEKSKTASINEEGVKKLEKLLNINNLCDPMNMEILHYVNTALRAQTMYKKDVDYIIDDGKVVIVDEFTGRMMEGRRFSDGLHQALEAKERLRVESENQTLATISFQNYFRLYKKLAGMTGTAATSAFEFKKIYNLDVEAIPTNKPLIREDKEDSIFSTEASKFNAVVEDIIIQSKTGRPVLVGTNSVEKSQFLSSLLKRKGIRHNVLNAKNHEKEAAIISEAGQKSAITISTNMAGRGVDIKLGSDVETLGGLYVIGTERHEAKRIDDQLRGRSGRQGDPGCSKFYVSLEDSIIRAFAKEQALKLAEIYKNDDAEITDSQNYKLFERTQQVIEGYNFEIRKHLLDFDNVMNMQREVVYKTRRDLLSGEPITGLVLSFIDEIISNIFSSNNVGDDDSTIIEKLKRVFPISTEEIKRNYLSEALIKKTIFAIYESKRNEIGKVEFDKIEKYILLQTLDFLWKEHLVSMDYLREGIGLRGYGHKDPVLEYKMEALNLFMEFELNFKENFLSKIFKMQTPAIK